MCCAEFLYFTRQGYHLQLHGCALLDYVKFLNFINSLTSMKLYQRTANLNHDTDLDMCRALNLFIRGTSKCA